MEGDPTNKEQQDEVTVSEEIHEALSAEYLIEGEDVRLPDYIKMKTELKHILTPVGIWSNEFDVWIDKNVGAISLLGKRIEQIGKWMEREKNPHKKEELERYRFDIERSLEQIGGWSPIFKTWLEDGSPADLKKVGEYMDYMGRARASIHAIRFAKDLEKDLSNKEGNGTDSVSQ
ncbi:MAG: hypothetical protein A2836_00125 [Candidatus Taylorbacteria bacterium RIFCSPHIGHO2_01_FULL_45_63]|uniref:Uncharacterized protein n=1 Tax=Candidatus Taylorbacteria bacterium RIFCSPHIGHO2_02_FULL_45_35 TaxID=1802311 RepID=A0A1G2MTY8_9BACT|nr:MAG: hypothetical protein A2836_00125 [Candidatus Taylorbacteria bacterium RIFCSPHIGHO2_01_FULL_45_63]OHA27194.1 MAG: hypothetical protein A3D56_01930 [Candidatus Taylorbacteria bacterium RIFCSPHIGHO2_02_FULL_45_35]OHA33688.1 MAG: hypothetical protein A3A22_03865 [Candidatus Taylorbacteria bacterium RIFCSPLOWO2_01_FULL_45_34b]